MRGRVCPRWRARWDAGQLGNLAIQGGTTRSDGDVCTYGFAKASDTLAQRHAAPKPALVAPELARSVQNGQFGCGGETRNHRNGASRAVLEKKRRGGGEERRRKGGNILSERA